MGLPRLGQIRRSRFCKGTGFRRPHAILRFALKDTHILKSISNLWIHLACVACMFLYVDLLSGNEV